MPDWLFHWTHDDVFKEVLKVSIPALGSILAALIAWYGIRRTAKVTQEALENSKEATPPELLRLEKWSTILTDSRNYPKNIKRKLDVNAIQSTYNDVLKRATLENRVMKLGILSSNVRNELISVNKIGVGYGVYPRPKWGGPKPNLKISYIIYWVLLPVYILISLALAFIFALYISVGIELYILLSFIFLVLISYIFAFKPAKKLEETLRENNIVFRNGYHALKYIYLIRGYKGVHETPEEDKERKAFEKTKEFKEWRDKVKKDHPEWTSWNYGLSINWDNNPDKDKADGSESEEPTDLVSSESIPEDPERQEP